jgi:MFS family permease
LNVAAAEAAPAAKLIIPALGVTQIVAWGSSYYLLAVLAKPIATDTGWPLEWVIAGVSLGLLCAGFVSPRVGDSIHRRGGQRMLVVSALLLAAGLALLGSAHAIVVYFTAWALIGAGMGAGLYDAAFATLGTFYGLRARHAIGVLTLFGGFASTICWPLSAYLVTHHGWRATCFAYALWHLVVALPIYLICLPREFRGSSGLSASTATSPTASGSSGPHATRPILVLLGTSIALSAVISTVISVHLITILQARHVSLVEAVGLGALVGPTQVFARIIEVAISRYHHPMWTQMAATVFVATGVGLLWAGFPILAAALMIYGAGIGIESIARATVPLAVFGAERYPRVMGRIAMPTLILQALAPVLAARLLSLVGATSTLAILFMIALVNVALVIGIFGVLSRERRHAARANA